MRIMYIGYIMICSGTLAGKREKIMSLLKKNIETGETFFLSIDKMFIKMS